VGYRAAAGRTVSCRSSKLGGGGGARLEIERMGTDEEGAPIPGEIKVREVCGWMAHIGFGSLKLSRGLLMLETIRTRFLHHLMDVRGLS
jgi:hypothetical protein